MTPNTSSTVDLTSASGMTSAAVAAHAETRHKANNMRNIEFTIALGHKRIGWRNAEVCMHVLGKFGIPPVPVQAPCQAVFWLDFKRL
jgi:hypothetical protein